MALEHYKKGETLTYIPHNQPCTVVYNSLLPGGLNADSALVTVRLKNNDLRNIPVKTQDEDLTRNPPVVRPRVLTVAKLK